MKPFSVLLSNLDPLVRPKRPPNGINDPPLRFQNHLDPLLLHLQPTPLRLLHHLHLQTLHPNKPLRESPHLRRQPQNVVVFVFILLFFFNNNVLSQKPSFVASHSHRPLAEDTVNTLRLDANKTPVAIIVVSIVNGVVVVFVFFFKGVERGEGGDGEGAALEVVHEGVVLPRARAEGGRGVLLLLLGTVALAELFHLVAALEGGLSGVGEVIAAAGGDNDGDLLPLVVAEWAPLKGIPLLLVGADEVHGLLVGPWYGLGLLCRCGVVWGGRH